MENATEKTLKIVEFNLRSESPNYYLTVDNKSENRSISPRSISPPRSIRGLNLFRAISRKLGKKQKEYSSDDDSNSSNDDSSQSRCGKYEKCECFYNRNDDDIIISLSPKNINICYSIDKVQNKVRHSKQCVHYKEPRVHSSCSDYSSNEDSSTSCDNSSRRRNNSSSIISNDSSSIVRKFMKSLNLNSGRSLSCSNITRKQIAANDKNDNVTNKEKRTKKSPKRILRQPVTYTYVRGMSGLPTHRVISSKQTGYQRGFC